MLDYRYHAISLIAVLIALVLGLLLGVTIGDSHLVSNFKGNVEESLNSDLKAARRHASDADKSLAQSNRFLQTAFPQMVKGQLRHQHVSLIGSAGATSGVTDQVRDAVESAGGTLDYAGEINPNPSIDAIASEMGIGVPAKQNAEQQLATAQRVGRAAGRRIARGPAAASSNLRELVFERFAGDFRRTKLNVYVRTPPSDQSHKTAQTATAFENGFVTGLAQINRVVVGAERTDSDPSEIKAYKSLGLSTVDDVDLYAGQYALVMVLSGATGDYGYKRTADSIIPPVAP